MVRTGKNRSNVLCLNVGSGVGLGMILNGELYQGVSGFSGEFGHIQMVPDGELCDCGKLAAWKQWRPVQPCSKSQKR
jgi:predicted NBD/HSP70 family sugar kinase